MPEPYDPLEPIDLPQEEEYLPLPDTGRRFRVWLVRALALVLALAFLLRATGGLLRLRGMPNLDFLMDSRVIARDPDVQRWMEAVVRVEADGSGGTGFNLDPSGVIVTNEHITEGASTVDVGFRSDGARHALSDWFSEPESDLSILSLEGMDGLPSLELERERVPVPGDPVLIIGNPLGFFRVANRATVLGFVRTSGMADPVLMLDGPVYRGNSGSPVLNADGRVIGVVFAATEHPETGRTVALAIAAPVVAYWADPILAERNEAP
jgi:S1-C subfamily serine protease